MNRFLAALLTVILAMISPPRGHAQQPSVGSDTTERFILNKLSYGEPADLETLPAAKQTVHARFIEELLAGQFKDGRIHWRGVRIRGAVFKERVDLHSATIIYRTSLTNSRFDGGIDLSESHFLKSLDLSGSHFSGAARFVNMNVDGNGIFNGTVFAGPTDFLFASMKADLVMNIAHLSGDTSFNTTAVAGNASFSDTEFKGEVDFRGAEFGRYALFDRSHFVQKVDFNNMKVKGAALFPDVVFDGPAVFLGAEIGEELNVSGAHFNDSNEQTSFSDMKVDRNILLVGTTFAGSVKFNFTRADGQLGIQDTKFGGDALINGVVLHELFIKDATFNKLLSIRDSDVGDLYLGMPAPPESLELDHLRYGEIGPNDGRGLVAWVEKSQYSRDNYIRLETFFASHGFSDQANDVFVRMKRRERREQFRWYRSFHWWSDLALDGLVKYGRAPQRAFYWSLLVLATGSLVFRKRQDMQSQKPEDSSPHYNPLWYSLDLFAPAIDLQIAKAWTPRHDWTFGRNYARFHRILGWILVPIGIAATAGLIK